MSGPLRPAHPFAGAFGLVLREIAVDAEITVGFRAGLLGDVHHAARRAVAVARRRRAADHFDALDLVGRHPVGVAAAVALAAPAMQRTELRELTGLPSTRIRVFSGPMPRMSICRLLPRWPLELLPVRLTPGMVRMITDQVVARRSLGVSSAVMMETPAPAWFPPGRWRPRSARPAR